MDIILGQPTDQPTDDVQTSSHGSFTLNNMITYCGFSMSTYPRPTCKQIQMALEQTYLRVLLMKAGELSPAIALHKIITSTLLLYFLYQLIIIIINMMIIFKTDDRHLSRRVCSFQKKFALIFNCSILTLLRL